ncbi:uncharacterized protein LOC123507385 [Portunus trituberculatus]|uniref:uncharacterized protein LOC123507385 n=1 Tax=Portunus trituberculatus TaxID=210409 RepID=UPI001E1CBF98|nr:uncharacterized protein LOC123507385 [Portunus trituberculatus]
MEVERQQKGMKVLKLDGIMKLDSKGDKAVGTYYNTDSKAHEMKVVKPREIYKCSQKTFITRDLVEKASLSTMSTENMTLQGFMTEPTTAIYDIVKPTIRMGNRRKRLTAVVVDELPKTIVTSGLSEIMERLSDQGIQLADMVSNDDRIGPVDMLIGSDHFYDFISPHIIMREGVHLLDSPSGYLITGKIPDTYKGTTMTASTPTIPEAIVVMKVCEQFNSLEDQNYDKDVPMHKLWDLDVIGIDSTQPNPEDNTSYHEYLKTVRYEEGQYWVTLPWKVNKPDLPNNYYRALGQMFSSVSALKKKGMLEAYDKILKEQKDAKFIEEVANATPTHNSHYLPHHGVIKESATTPLRIVFNCSSKPDTGTASLNDCLMTGQNLTKGLGDILLTFRTGKYAYSADISKAFLRIGLQERDRDYTRFLWPSDPNDPDSPITTYRFRSILFGATSSPFLLQATLDHHFRNSTSPHKELLASNFYVDNFLGTVTDDILLKAVYSEAKNENELRLANMPLREWASNSDSLRTQIAEDFPEYKLPHITPILGLEWNTIDDTLSLKPVKYPQTNQTCLTKRLLLAEVSKLIDPLGLFSPVTIKVKLLLQDAWKLKIDWDEQLPESVKTEWNKLKDEYLQIPTHKINRSIATGEESCTLHIFCDASTKAYGAAAYIVTKEASNLLTSKARVAPIKKRSVPQLELTAMLVGTKLGNYIHETLKLNLKETYLWSDSEAALQWLRKDNSTIPYVKNRVAEIRDTKGNFQFLHVTTKLNPADLLSRGVPLKQLLNYPVWFEGPDWLSEKDKWPEQKIQDISSVTHSSNTETKEKEPYELIDGKRFSTLGKLFRVTSYVLQFISNLYRRIGRSLPTGVGNATTYWIKETRKAFYHDEFLCLHSLAKGDPYQVEMSEMPCASISKTPELPKGALGTSIIDTSTDRGTGSELSTKTLRDSLCSAPKANDQVILWREVWPVAHLNGTVHDAYTCKRFSGSLPFPSPRFNFTFVGMRTYRKNFKKDSVHNKCPPACRPKEHQDWLYC